VTDTPRLIEHAFPLKQASLDSVHEKNVRHGHISTLHIWPARRPLAACRAALIATLLPDPSAQPKPEEMSDEDWQKEIIRLRRELCEKIGGKTVKTVEKKKMPNGQIVEREKEETSGGILHWGLETKNKELLDWFRQEIRKAHGSRAPKVLDPFAGGGAIPLEAMRLGCAATAVDINPVAWFLLKCTLEYPHRLAGKTFPLPELILDDESFMEAFYKAHSHLIGRTKKTKKQQESEERAPGLFDKPDSGRAPKADLAWHVRAWGQWVLKNARRELAAYYPAYADFEPISGAFPKPYEKQPLQLVPLSEEGTPDGAALNVEFSEEYLRDKGNPRWVAKPTVAYLWARTVACKNCRAVIPLLKTRWLCKKDKKRVLLTMAPNADRSSATFGIEANVPVKGGNAAQRRENDKQIGGGTMSRSGARCPCCGTIMTMEDIRLEGKAGRLGAVNTAVVVDGQRGQEYRMPTDHEIRMAAEAEKGVPGVFAEIPFGLPEEPLPSKEALGFRVPLYGFDQWRKLFTSRQLLALGTFVKWTRTATQTLKGRNHSHSNWGEAVAAGLAIGMDRIADRQSNVCRWDNGYTKLQGTFTRFALPITWDFCEGNPFSETTGNYAANLEWVAEFWEHATRAASGSPTPIVENRSAIRPSVQGFDAIVTDPPYYDAIPYSDLMDFFHIWLRRTLHGLHADASLAFEKPVGPKWDEGQNDGELIDDASRHGGNRAQSRQVYEDGMARVFQSCCDALAPHGRFVVVFAHKHPDAWETLVTAIIRAGFVVDGSWTIQTEMMNRTRGLSSAALSSSGWLGCRKRHAPARPGCDNQVLEEMRQKIRTQLR